MRLHLAAVSMMLAASACESSEPELPDFAELQPADAVELVDIPESREDFLAVLAPMPFGSVRIDYEVTGPGGMHGSLELLAAPGGYRRESWDLELPTAVGDPIALEGASIQTPDRAWTDAVEGADIVRDVPLGSIADAYVALAPDARASVDATLRRYHAELAAGRAARPGTRAQVQGHDCLVTRVASHRLCVWEETGLPLQYTGAAFDIVAQRIETDAPIPEHAFEVPPGARPATNDAGGFDPTQSLQRLAAGDVAELAILLQPGLRLPPA